MVRERLDRMWIDAMNALFENQPDLPDKDVAERLMKKGEELGREDYPALRTVNKYHRMYQPQNQRERAAYKVFAWPEEMGSDLLPWEASQAALELLGVLFSPEYTEYPRLLGSDTPRINFDHFPFGRPTILLVHWFWRVTLAAPDMPARIEDSSIFDYRQDGVVKTLKPEDMSDYDDGGHAGMAPGPDRFTAAQQLTAWEILGNPPSEKVRQLETYLAWRTAPAHLKVLTEEPPFPLFSAASGQMDIEKSVAVVATLKGAEAANRYNVLRRYYPEAFNDREE